MMKQAKKITALILSLAMAFSCACLPVMAAEVSEDDPAVVAEELSVLEQAKAAEEAGDTATAISLYKQLGSEAQSAGDYELAVEYYLSAGALGDGFSYFDAGSLYEQGLVSGEPDYAKAEECYINAAEATTNNCKGLRNIGQWYENGNSYVEQDYQMAAYYYEWAIEIDDASSCYYLGNLYEQGYLSEDGQPDYVNAAVYYQKAYDKNNISASGVSTAVYRLGYLYENGLGVEKDLELAKKYYEAVAATTKPEAADAQAALDRLNSEETSVDTSEVAGTYTYDGQELVLGEDGTFTLGEVSGTFEYSASYNKFRKSWSVLLTLDDASTAALSDLIPWYGAIALDATGDANTMTLGDTFSISVDVSKALISANESKDDYTFETVANPDSPTGYTTTITVTDRGYENVYAYGDWMSSWLKLTDPNDPTSYDPTLYDVDEWKNGMYYAGSSVKKLTKNKDGDWSLTLNLASSVMGVICYHDVNEEDLHDLFPLKLNFCVPYDEVKQSESFDWSAAFPNENAAGTVDYDVTCTLNNGEQAQLSVYTPVGYDSADTDTKYPVLYMIPGGSTTYKSFYESCMANNIFDNLIESGDVAPTIVVSMERETGTSYLSDVVEYIEANYNTYGDAEHRSLMGISMGSVASTNIWRADPTQFGYYAFMSGADKTTFNINAEGYEYEELTEEYVAQLKDATYFIAGGTTDFNMFTGDGNSAGIYQLDQWMDHYDIEHGYGIVVGEHNWPTWIPLTITYASDYLWENEETSEPVTVTATSDILGLGDTNNKTTMKYELIKASGPGDTKIYYYDENGVRQAFDLEEGEKAPITTDKVSYTGSAVLTLEGKNIDDSKIDSSNASVHLIDGNAYHADELILSADKLVGEWKNGSITYTLSEGDLEWNTWDIDCTIDPNSGREWSMMGGDAAGGYFFTFEVSGIKYDGVELDPVTFPVNVYIYGRTCTDLTANMAFVENTYDASYTSGKSQSGEAQWTWYTENETSQADKPYLNDTFTDYISLTYPNGVDGSSVTADDVTVTLKSVYGDEYTLSTKTAYGETEYAVASSASETEIFVTYQQWAVVPVYSTMSITVKCGDEEYTKDYDVASVAIYEVQTGGGGVTVDGTITAHNFYGLVDISDDVITGQYYTLSVEKDGTTYFYCKDGTLKEGTVVQSFRGPTITAPDDAVKYDATYDDGTPLIAVRGNVVFVRSRVGQTTEKEVNGEMITFNNNYTTSYMNQATMIAQGTAKLDKGYNLSGGCLQWAWTKRYQAGWTVEDDEPTSLPYDVFPFTGETIKEGDIVYPYGFAPGSYNPAPDYVNMNPGSNPDQPGGPGAPGEPTDPDNPGTPGGPVDPDNPGTPGGPVDPDNPDTPVELVDPDTPDTPVGPVDPDDSDTSDNNGNKVINIIDNKNGKGNSSTSKTTDKENTSFVKTGDENNLILWSMLLVVAATALVIAFFVKKKKSVK